jgi:hypothetical protein
MGRSERPAGSRVRYTRDGRAKRVYTDGAQWSEEAEDVFFEHLAASCNVTASAAAAGFGHTTVYRHRLLRPEFAARWQAALSQGYARLELALLEAASNSLAGMTFDPDHPIPKMSFEQAMDLLRFHQQSVKGERHPGGHARVRSLDEVRASILKKVEAIRNAEREARNEKRRARRALPHAAQGIERGRPRSVDSKPGD